MDIVSLRTIQEKRNDFFKRIFLSLRMIHLEIMKDPVMKVEMKMMDEEKYFLNTVSMKTMCAEHLLN